MIKFFLKGLLTEKHMANTTSKIDHQILKKAWNIARKKKISLDTIVEQKLKEFVSAHQKKGLHWQG
jgi:predicted HicB family RNase H-like nuclease